MVCKECGPGTDGVRLEETELYTMQYILSAKLERLYTFAVSGQVLQKLEQILDRFFAAQTDHEFRSL